MKVPTTLNAISVDLARKDEVPPELGGPAASLAEVGFVKWKTNGLWTNDKEMSSICRHQIYGMQYSKFVVYIVHLLHLILDYDELDELTCCQDELGSHARPTWKWVPKEALLVHHICLTLHPNKGTILDGANLMQLSSPTVCWERATWYADICWTLYWLSKYDELRFSKRIPRKEAFSQNAIWKVHSYFLWTVKFVAIFARHNELYRSLWYNLPCFRCLF